MVRVRVRVRVRVSVRVSVRSSPPIGLGLTARVGVYARACGLCYWLPYPGFTPLPHHHLVQGQGYLNRIEFDMGLDFGVEDCQPQLTHGQG